MMPTSVDYVRKIVEKYPFLDNGEPLIFATDGKEYSYIPFTGDIPDGWVKLFLNLCEDLRIQLEKENALKDFCFVQVKEKFNELRCYTSPCSDAVSDILSKYEWVSRFICSKCGQKAKYETSGYILSYCNKCILDKALVYAEELPNFDDCSTIVKKHFFNKRKLKNLFRKQKIKRIDCTDVWKRYFGE